MITVNDGYLRLVNHVSTIFSEKEKKLHKSLREQMGEEDSGGMRVESSPRDQVFVFLLASFACFEIRDDPI